MHAVVHHLATVMSNITDCPCLANERKRDTIVYCLFVQQTVLKTNCCHKIGRDTFAMGGKLEYSDITQVIFCGNIVGTTQTETEGKVSPTLRCTSQPASLDSAKRYRVDKRTRRTHKMEQRSISISYQGFHTMTKRTHG